MLPDALRSAYRDRRVLVTGHTGFKGSWLCSALIGVGATVSGVALAPETQPNLFDGLRLADAVASHIADIRDLMALRRVFAQVQPDIVFHLAAQPLVRRSYADPLATFATNVLGTAHVLETARATASVRAVVVVTTDKVYKNHDGNRPYRESDPLGGLDPYSASKAAAEVIAEAYQKNLCRGGVAIATARGGNVIGGGDWSEDRIVPDIVRAITKGEPILLRNPDAVRPWQHVLELCEAYLELGARLLESGDAFAECWNFGPFADQVVTVEGLARMIMQIWGCPDHPVQVQPSPLHEAQILRLDISHALQRLSWRPRLGLHRAMQWTASWYKDFYQEPGKARAITANQVRAFSELMR